MTCVQVRVALSARLDGEDPGIPVAEVDGHVSGCDECQEWLAQAEYMTRMVRVQPVSVPDLTDRVLAALAADAPTTVRARHQDAGRRQVLRFAVGFAAVAQLTLAVPVLLGLSGVVDDAHLTREMASLDIALAVGFVLAAYRPERARTFVPVAFVLAACLAVTSAIDIVNASTAMVHEVGHLAAVVQAALLWALGRTSEPGGARLAGIAAPGPAA